MTVLALDHVAITVADIDRSLIFWRDLLGLDLTGRGEVAYEHLDRIVGLDDTRIEWAELAFPGGQVLELFRYLSPAGTRMAPAPNDPGATHVCLRVRDLDTLCTRLLEAGVRFRSPGPVEIPTGGWRGWRDLYVHDPDGVVVELSEAPAQAGDPDARMARHGSCASTPQGGSAGSVNRPA